MVGLRPTVPLLALLSALALAVPSASADVLDAVDGIAKVTGLPHVPLVDQLPDGDVQWTVYDGGLHAQGAGVQTEASCTIGNIAEASCSGYVCFMDPGSGPLPVSLGDWGRGMVGVGVDLASVEALAPIVIHTGTDAAQPQDGADAQPQDGPVDGGGYGPYDGVFVNPTGHCGP